MDHGNHEADIEFGRDGNSAARRDVTTALLIFLPPADSTYAGSLSRRRVGRKSCFRFRSSGLKSFFGNSRRRSCNSEGSPVE
jgi:hypothetical protein